MKMQIRCPRQSIFEEALVSSIACVKNLRQLIFRFRLGHETRSLSYGTNFIGIYVVWCVTETHLITFIVPDSNRFLDWRYLHPMQWTVLISDSLRSFDRQRRWDFEQKEKREECHWCNPRLHNKSVTYLSLLNYFSPIHVTCSSLSGKFFFPFPRKSLQPSLGAKQWRMRARCKRNALTSFVCIKVKIFTLKVQNHLSMGMQ